jgi:multidrug resistance efflux pump
MVAANSDLALAEATLKRCRYLYEQKVVSQQEFDEVNARHQATLARRDIAQAGQAQARAVLNQATTSLGYTSLLRWSILRRGEDSRRLGAVTGN